TSTRPATRAPARPARPPGTAAAPRRTGAPRAATPAARPAARAAGRAGRAGTRAPYAPPLGRSADRPTLPPQHEMPDRLFRNRSYLSLTFSSDPRPVISPRGTLSQPGSGSRSRGAGRGG